MTKPVKARDFISQVRHACIDLAGVRRWCNKDLERLFTLEGEHISAAEIRKWIDEQIKDGVRVVPLGPECNNFDKVKGCMGHPIIE